MSAQLASGLALAGANEGPTGILTAEEMAGLDWRGTKLVVLSACNTAQGDTPSGDGVYGMRRALVLAGAETQVITLWNVSDQSGPELMRLFYRALANGTARGEALRQAKRDLSRDPRYAHPYFWAPFVLAGAWGPLGSGVLAHGGAP
jgi:CHAT domain-containing protein